MDITVKARLVAKRSELYSKYVFLDLIKNEFLMKWPVFKKG